MTETGAVEVGAVPVPAPNAVLECFGDESVLYDPDSGTLLQLNLTATLIWLACDATADVGTIAATFITLAKADPNQVLAEVRGAIAAFGNEGLVTLERR